MAVLVSDSFNRGDSNTTLGTTDSANGGTAKAWNYVRSTWGIIGNKAYMVSATVNPPVGNGGALFYAWVEAGASDVSVTTTVTDMNDTYALSFRIDPTADSYILYHGKTGAVQTTTSNSYTTIATLQPLVSGDIMKVTAQGNTLTFYRNGTNIGVVTTTFNQTATKYGLSNWRNTVTTTDGTWDNFIVEDLATGGTGTDVSTVAAVKVSFFAQRAEIASVQQRFYAQRSDASAIRQSFSANRSDAAAIWQSFYAQRSDAVAIRQSFYAQRSDPYPLNQKFYAQRSDPYPIMITLYADYIPFTASYPIKIVMTAQRSETVPLRVSMYANRSTLVPLLQRVYANRSASFLLQQKFYQSFSDLAGIEQRFFAQRLEAVPIRILMVDPDHVITIGRIVLMGRRDLLIRLMGSRVVDIIMRGDLNVTATNQNFSMYAGEYKDIRIPVAGEQDLAGSVIEWTLRKEEGGEVLVTKSTEVKITGSELSIPLLPADTASRSGVFLHAAKLTDVTGKPSFITTGFITIKRG